jgi:hypothetical protein
MWARIRPFMAREGWQTKASFTGLWAYSRYRACNFWESSKCTLIWARYTTVRYTKFSKLCWFHLNQLIYLLILKKWLKTLPLTLPWDSISRTDMIWLHLDKEEFSFCKNNQRTLFKE